MSKPLRALLTLALLAAFAGALFYALRGQQQEQIAQQEAASIASVTELNGLIALDVEPYFKDPRAHKLLAPKRLPLKVTRVGSRDMAAKAVAGAMPEFFFPSGVVAANQIADAARQAN